MQIRTKNQNTGDAKVMTAGSCHVQAHVHIQIPGVLDQGF